MKRFCNILYVADAEQNDKAALERALQLAESNQAKLTIVGIVPAGDLEKMASSARARQLIEGMTNARREALLSHPALPESVPDYVDIKILVGKDFLEIIREVISENRDLVIKPVASPKGVAQLLGSTDMKLLRKCPCPVWLIHSAEQVGDREILAAVDFDPEDATNDELNAQILELAASLALADFAALHVVHTWRLPHEDFMRSPRSGMSHAEVDELVNEEETTRRRWLEALVAKHCGTAGSRTAEFLKPTIHLLQGKADQLVPALERELGAELIVMGTVGRTGIPGFLIGNTAESILQQIRCSVLTVKPAGFVSPVSPGA